MCARVCTSTRKSLTPVHACRHGPRLSSTILWLRLSVRWTHVAAASWPRAGEDRSTYSDDKSFHALCHTCEPCDARSRMKHEDRRLAADSRGRKLQRPRWSRSQGTARRGGATGGRVVARHSFAQDALVCCVHIWIPSLFCPKNALRHIPYAVTHQRAPSDFPLRGRGGHALSSAAP